MRNLWRRSTGSCVSQFKRKLSPWLEFGLNAANLSSFHRGICVYLLELFKRIAIVHYQNSNRAFISCS